MSELPAPHQDVSSIADLLERCAYLSPQGRDLVERSYTLAHFAHRAQRRRSGEPYITHPLAVTGYLADLQLDAETLSTGLLHDTLEDCPISFEVIAERSSPIVASLVDGVTKIGKLKYSSKAQVAAESFRKMVLAMSEDIRVLVVKLHDRLHNMRTMGAMRPDKQRKKSQETMDIYVPLAGRLGMMSLRVELENLCFCYLYPVAYERLREQLLEAGQHQEAYMDRVQAELKSYLQTLSIQGQVQGRMKHMWSIHRKMMSRGLERPNQLHDMLAFRLIVEEVEDCYALLGHIHGLYEPIQGRIKDYIAMPKSNGYQSLHTTVLGPEGRRVEVQIRTASMHRVAEQGIAAHWSYKEGGSASLGSDQIRRLRSLVEAAQEVVNPEQFMSQALSDLVIEDVYVFTPDGDVKELPQGATLLDFAFSVHTEVGMSCVGGLVDGKQASLGHPLRTGNTVSIQTRPDQRPREHWKGLVQTGRARRAILRYLSSLEHEQGRQRGREILEQALQSKGSSLRRVLKSGDLQRVLQERGYRSDQEMLLQLAKGHITPATLLRDLFPEDKPETSSALLGRGSFIKLFQKLLPQGREEESKGILIGGEDDVYVNFARCCNPLPQEPVGGYITRGNGITVHRSDCIQFQRMDPERVIDVCWRGGEGPLHSTTLRIVCRNQRGLLAKLTRTCTDSGLDLTMASARGLDELTAECLFEFGVQSQQQLQKIQQQLSSIEGVLSVHRS